MEEPSGASGYTEQEGVPAGRFVPTVEGPTAPSVAQPIGAS